MGISYKTAINEKCKDCSYDELDVGNWRQQVGRCMVTLCPLYAVRPISKPKPAKTVKTDDLSTIGDEL